MDRVRQRCIALTAFLVSAPIAVASILLASTTVSAVNTQNPFDYAMINPAPATSVYSEANFEVSKKVKRHGTLGWKDYLEVNPGDIIDYLIEYENTGTVSQKNVVIKDTLPEGASYLEGTTRYFNTFNPAPIGAPASDGLLGLRGINIGNYAPGSNGLVRYSARIIGFKGTITTNAAVETDNGWKAAGVKVIIKDTIGASKRTNEQGAPSNHDIKENSSLLPSLSDITQGLTIATISALSTVTLFALLFLLAKRFQWAEDITRKLWKWQNHKRTWFKERKPFPRKKSDSSKGQRRQSRQKVVRKSTGAS